MRGRQKLIWSTVVASQDCERGLSIRHFLLVLVVMVYSPVGVHMIEFSVKRRDFSILLKRGIGEFCWKNSTSRFWIFFPDYQMNFT